MEELEMEQEIFKVFLRGCPTYTMKLRIKLEDYVYIRMKSEKKRGIGRNHIPLLCAPCLQTRLDGQ